MEETTYYCRICGEKLSPTATAVSAHYEKKHFSEWVANKDIMARMPKAFVATKKPGTQTAAAPTPTLQQVQEKQAANKASIQERLKFCMEKSHYRERKPYICPCCEREMITGMQIACRRERFILCYDCYNENHTAIPHKTRPVERLG